MNARWFQEQQRSIYFGSAVGFLLLMTSAALGQEDWPPGLKTEAMRTNVYRGASDCARCHIRPGPNDNPENNETGSLEWCLLTEFSTWRTVDKHSMAYVVLLGPRAELMGKKLGIENVTKPESGCVSCHAQNFPEQQPDGGGFDFRDGINCEVCHGPSGLNTGWFGPHSETSWRLKSPAEKEEEFGMIDLRNPATKSEICLSCHIGNAELGRVVTHPMYAAGHPPLPSIDVARFIKNIPRHWRDLDEVPWWESQEAAQVQDDYGYSSTKHVETELTIVGNIIALRDSMGLLAARAELSDASKENLHKWPELALNRQVRDDDRFNDPNQFPQLAKTRWPEMALTHTDCSACHHDLQEPGWRQLRGYVATPGRPLPRSFPTALIDITIKQFGDHTDQSNFDNRLLKLITAFDRRPFGDHRTVASAARELQQWADEFHETRLVGQPFDEATALEILRAICAQTGDQIPDYDTARQLSSAIQVIYREWADRRSDDSDEGGDAIREIIDPWSDQYVLGRYPNSSDRDQLSLKILREASGQPGLSDLLAWVPEWNWQFDDLGQYYELTRNNSVLEELQGTLTTGKLREEYSKPKFSDPLQDINDSGLSIALESSADYDPMVFVIQLQEIQRLLDDIDE